MSIYSKPYLTFEQQLELLKSRGLQITNDAKAIEYLRRIGYYRLSAYWYPLRELIPVTDHASTATSCEPRDDFIPSAKFHDSVNLYIFDKKLRLLILDALERIEVALRVDISYLIGSKDPFGHTNPQLLHGNFVKRVDAHTNKTKYQVWLAKHDELTNRSKEDFVRHYKKKYGLPLPIWVSIELWDFGLLSTFYQGMKVDDKASIAMKYDITRWEIMESWLRCLNYIRNVVAHHGRLWNRNLVDQPKLPKQGEIPRFDSIIGKGGSISRVYVALCIIIHLMQYVCPDSKWPMRLGELLSTLTEIPFANITDMGFPADWELQDFWPK